MIKYYSSEEKPIYIQGLMDGIAWGCWVALAGRGVEKIAL